MKTEQNKLPSITRLHPWDAAKKLKVLLGTAGYPVADLEPGVKFFVLMLQQLGATTLYSCEGHPHGFYVMFRCPYEIALNLHKCGFFTVGIFGPDTWTIRFPEHRVKSPREKAQSLRWAAESWERNLGELRLLQ